MLTKWWGQIRRMLQWGSGTRPLPWNCANCGAQLTQRHFCRSCGASEESGWAAPDWGEDDDEDDFDYDDFVRREFGDGRSRHQGVAATTWGTVLILLIVFGLLLAQFGGLLI